MVLVTLVAILVAWTAVALVVVGLCVAAKRGDQPLPAEAMEPLTTSITTVLGEPDPAAVTAA